VFPLIFVCFCPKIGSKIDNVAYPPLYQERYFQNARKKGFKQVLERSDGVLGFSKTKFYFEQKKIDQKLANGHAEKLSGKSAA
jgi:hypothetical protein